MGIPWSHPQRRLLLWLWGVVQDSPFSVGGLETGVLGTGIFGESNAFCPF